MWKLVTKMNELCSKPCFKPLPKQSQTVGFFSFSAQIQKKKKMQKTSGKDSKWRKEIMGVSIPALQGVVTIMCKIIPMLQNLLIDEFFQPKMSWPHPLLRTLWAVFFLRSTAILEFRDRTQGKKAKHSKITGHSFPLARFIRIKRFINIPYHLLAVVQVPGHIACTR